MDIKNLQTGVTSSRSTESLRANERAVSEQKGQASSAPTDRVTLTDTLGQVRELEQKTEAVNIDNSERLASLKAAIQDGSYQVNAQNVADKLLQSENFLANI